VGRPAHTCRRCCAGLGRSVLEPLALLAALCGEGMEVLSLPIHPLQKAASNSAKMRVVQQVMITAVNQVGVDLNLVAQCSWMAPMLQFVCGLGPRKASALLSSVSKRDGGFIHSRGDMYRELNVMDKNVFVNCGPFLRIRKAGTAMVNLNLDRKDDTRIHPLNYGWAIKIAQDAGGYQDRSIVDDDSLVVEHAMDHPDLVLQLDMWDAADKLRQKENISEEVISRLIDIQYELVAPYMELRGDSMPPSENEVFDLLTSDGCDNGLQEGKMVEATVMFIRDEEVELQLEGGIPAKLEREYVSSSRNPEELRLRDIMQRGQHIRARILGIDSKNFVVRLTCRSKDLADDLRWEQQYCADKDEYYHLLTEEERQAKLDARKKATSKKGTLAQRPIRHENYRNCTAKQASEMLQDSEVGEFLFRPSSQGLDFLGLTMVVHKARGGNLIMHITIKEGPKPGSGPGSRLSLGKWLVVDSSTNVPRDEKYEDLDEVAARFVEPFVSNVKAITSHRKFKDGSQADIDAALKEEKRRSAPGMVGDGLLSSRPCCIACC